MEAMGHTFNEELVCNGCGIGYWAHQSALQAKQCPAKPKGPADRDSPMAQFRDAMLIAEFLAGQLDLKELAQRYKISYTTMHEITKEASDKRADAVVADFEAGVPDQEIIERNNLRTPHKLGRVLASRGISKKDRKNLARMRERDEQEIDV